jgi:hypothetical protein
MKLATRLMAVLAGCLGTLATARADPIDLAGAWTLDVKGSMRPRALVVARHGDELAVRYGFLEPGAKLGNVAASVDPSGAFTIRTSADSVVVLAPVDAATLRGTFTPRDGRPSRVTALRSTAEAHAAVLGSGPPSAVAELGRVATARAEAEARPDAPAPSDVHFIWMGGNDCPPCMAWRANELPKLRTLPEFQRIRYSYVTKTIPSAVPPRFFLPPEVQPLKEVLDVAGAGTPGSPQAAVIVNGQVYDYFWGVRSAEEIESMLRSIRTGSKYPFVRCLKMAAESRKCGVTA